MTKIEIKPSQDVSSSFDCYASSATPATVAYSSASDDALTSSSSISIARHASASSVVTAAPHSITGTYSQIEHKYHIEKDQVLGTGFNSSVKVGVDRQTGKRYAVKSIHKGDPSVHLQDLHREVELLREVKHENVVQLKDVYEDENWVHIVTELCEGGELFDRIVQNKKKSPGAGCFPEGEAAKVLRQILTAVAYLHENDIVHRDIKPENLVFETKEESSAIKLIDFGVARKHYEDSLERHMSTCVGTSYFIAPEVLREKYDKSCDLWSVGVVAFIMMCGYPPFNGKRNKEVCAAIKRGKYHFDSQQWKGVSKEAKDFIRRLLQANPKKRMTPEQALNHPWLVKHAVMKAEVQPNNSCVEVVLKKHRSKGVALPFGGVKQRKGKMRLSMFRL